MRTFAIAALAACMGIQSVAMPARAQFSAETMDRVIAIVCSEEKIISAPEKHLWEERCNYRFEHDGARLWFFTHQVTDFKEERCMVPKPWCRPPYRSLGIVVRWPHIDEPNFEEFLTDDDMSGAVSFAVLQSSVRNDLRFRLEEPETLVSERIPAQGLEHQAMWTGRHAELIKALLAYAGTAPGS